jgi:hypothetical protein
MRAYVSRHGSGFSFGWIGTLVVATGWVLIAVFWMAVVALIICAVGLMLLVALVALGADKLLTLTSSRWRARRAVRGPLRATQRTLDGGKNAVQSITPGSRKRSQRGS